MGTKAMDTWIVTVTDTFGGEANFSWVRKYSFSAPPDASQRLLMRRAKAAAGMSGVRGNTDSYGDSFTFRPSGCCVVAFIELDYDGATGNHD